MPPFKLPLSGDVVQSINPMTTLFSPSGGQYGLININLGRSTEPKVEAEVLSDVATYGKQLGRIGDALIVLINYLRKDSAHALSDEESKAVEALEAMLNEIADIKQKHGRPTMRP